MSRLEYQSDLLRRYRWIKGLEERRSDDSFEDTLVVTAEDGEVYSVAVDRRRASQLAHVFIRLDEITYNRKVAADTEDWYDAPNGGQFD